MFDIKQIMMPRTVEDVEAIMDYTQANKLKVDGSNTLQLRIIQSMIVDSIKSYHKKQGFFSFAIYKLSPKYKLRWVRKNLSVKELLNLWEYLQQIENNETTEKKKLI
jgi:hypothetical protein